MIFDLDNTIWDFETNSREALTELYAQVKQQHAIEAEFQHFHSTYVEINYRYWADYEKGLIDKHTLRYGRFHEAFSKMDFHRTDVIDRVADEYVRISPFKNVLFEGTHEVLEYLQSKYRLAIITNGFNEVVAHKMKNCGLEKYFEHVQTSEDAGWQKPDKRIFNLVMQKCNGTPANSIMIGDNLDTDIAGGKGAGMRTILFDSKKQHLNYTDTKIHSLLDLKQLL